MDDPFSFSDGQLAVLHLAQAILDSAGLSPQALSHSSPGSSRSCTPSEPVPSPEPSIPPLTDPRTLPPSSAVLALRYEPPVAHKFTDNEINQRLNKVNRQTYVDAIIEHPPGAVVEYPQTGEVTGASIAHIFNVDSDPSRFIHPKSNFQYSLGDGHGGRDNVVCRLLTSKSGSSVLCYKLRTSCKSVIIV
ncbi:hypothetical protein BU15DRAFT_52007 [Melanogaster broomeanus]|nr:hypothetical protein BU15DRAFT_52007 [Melanogaster broomeanus]